MTLAISFRVVGSGEERDNNYLERSRVIIRGSTIVVLVVLVALIFVSVAALVPVVQ